MTKGQLSPIDRLITDLSVKLIVGLTVKTTTQNVRTAELLILLMLMSDWMILMRLGGIC